MLEGFDVDITQQGHAFIVTGKDVAKLHEKLKKAPIYKGFVASAIKEDGTFTLEKYAEPMPTAMAN